MKSLYYFNDENLKTGFKNNLQSHDIKDANSILILKGKYTDSEIETRYNKRISNEMATFYARLINQYKFKLNVLFSAIFSKNKEDDQIVMKLKYLSN